MKKGDIYTGIIEESLYPDKGIIHNENTKVVIKHAIPKREVEYLITKKRNGSCEARVTKLLKMAPYENAVIACKHFDSCGGCLYQTIPYDIQLELKSTQIEKLLRAAAEYDFEYEGIIPSPISHGYRNKMEYSFGDEYKGGELSLGMHKRGSHYDIVRTDTCNIVNDDFNIILATSCDFFKDRAVDFYHKRDNKGYLRHLLIRRGIKSKEILVDLVTTGQMAAGDEEKLLCDWTKMVKSLKLEGHISGILHTTNNSAADAVIDEGTKILYGKAEIYEELLGLKFRISTFSFFQTNSLGAEKLYEKAGEYIGDTSGKVVYDLYSGTGTIAQLLASKAKKAVGVEIVEEAVDAARDNARLNNINNCEFIAGDVLKVIDELKEKPDIIVLDPPRDGIHPKALPKILSFGVNEIIYISCKPSSLARDIKVMTAAGYKIKKACSVDMFPHTANTEVCCLLTKAKGSEA